jgi:hypothetical protein
MGEPARYTFDSRGIIGARARPANDLTRASVDFGRDELLDTAPLTRALHGGVQKVEARQHGEPCHRRDEPDLTTACALVGKAAQREMQGAGDRERGQADEDCVEAVQVEGAEEKRWPPGGQAEAGGTQGRHEGGGDGHPWQRQALVAT